MTEPADYMDLFKPDAPWSKAASGLAVFKVGARFVLIADDAELRTMIDDLRRQHIAFAVELGVLESGGPGTCGYGVEGYANPTGVESIAKRIQAIGGRIDYVAMDEPVWFGHIVDKVAKSAGRGCRYSVPEIGEMAAAKIALLRRYFPDIKIGDIEPVSARAPGGPQSIEDILTFEICCARKPAPPRLLPRGRGLGLPRLAAQCRVESCRAWRAWSRWREILALGVWTAVSNFKVWRRSSSVCSPVTSKTQMMIAIPKNYGAAVATRRDRRRLQL